MGKTRMTRHHRKPVSRGGNGKPYNISQVPDNKHQAYHLLFANLNPENVARILNETWIRSDYILIAVPRSSIK